MSKNTIILSVAIVLLLGIAGYLVLTSPQRDGSKNPSQPSLASTTTPNGNQKPNQISPTPEAKDIRIIYPGYNQVITSPVQIKGDVVSSWFFEGVFPVKLLDSNKKIIAQGNAKAKGNWATSTRTAFELTLSYPLPTTDTGTLVFENDNPSGLPEKAKTYSVPVRFSNNTINKVTVSLFYQSTKSANQLKDQCSLDSVIGLKRQIPRTNTPLQDTIKLLIQGQLSQDEKAEGFVTEFPKAGFTLKGANLKNGTLTLEFTPVPGFTSGGACRVGLLKESIIKTAMQFAEVKKVEFKPTTLFQP